MSASYTTSLLVTIGALVAFRLLVLHGPIRGLARPVNRWSVVLVGMAGIGLTLHCTAMFGRPIVEALPGTDAYVASVNAMGRSSIVLYAVPAVLLLAGLLRQRPLVLLILAAALLAVGVTMYDNGSVAIHLAFIFVTVTLIAATITLMITSVERARRPA